MKILLPYLTVKNASLLIDYYNKIFGVQVEYKTTYGEMPRDDVGFQWSEDDDDLIAFASLKFPNGQLMYLSDSFPGSSEIENSNVSLYIAFDDKDEIKRVFEELASEGEVLMELENTFWSELFASVKDKFGIEWNLEYTTKIPEISKVVENPRH